MSFGSLGSLGRRFGSFGSLLGGAGKSGQAAISFVVLAPGHSNQQGNANDQSAGGYIVTPLVQAWDGANFQNYNPGNFTGTSFTAANGQIGPDLALINALLTAFPGVTFLYLKSGDPGTFASPPVTSEVTFVNSYAPATLGQRYTTFKASVLAAYAKLATFGLNPPIKIVFPYLGGNDAAFTDTASAFQTNYSTLIAAIRADLPVTPGLTKYLLPTVEVGRTFSSTVLGLQKAQLWSTPTSDMFLLDESTAAFNTGTNTSHYAMAGLNKIGGDVATAALNGLKTQRVSLGSQVVGYFCADDWVLASAGDAAPASSGSVGQWIDTVGNHSPSFNNTKPTLNATGINSKPSTEYGGTNQSFLYTGTTGWPSGSASAEYWLTVRQDFVAGVDSNGHAAFCHQPNTGNSSVAARRIERIQSAGVNRASFSVGLGASAVAVTDTNVDLSGIHVIRCYVDQANSLIGIQVDGGIVTTTACAANTGDFKAFIGTSQLGGWWKGGIRVVMVVNQLLGASDLAATWAAFRADAGV